MCYVLCEYWWLQRRQKMCAYCNNTFKYNILENFCQEKTFKKNHRDECPCFLQNTIIHKDLVIREHGDLHSPRRCSPVAEYVEYEGGVEIMLRIQELFLQIQISLIKRLNIKLLSKS